MKPTLFWSMSTFSKQVITVFTVGRCGGEMLHRHTVGDLLGGLGEVLGRFWVGFSKVLEGKREAEKS